MEQYSSRCSPLMPVPAALLCLLLLHQPHAASSDAASDRAECSDQLVGLATCLSYVQGGAKTPSPDCCAGLKQVLSKSPKCLCVLVKDRDDPSLGLKINVTLALSLPSVCGARANVSECPKLLNLPPDSKDAQVFKQSGSAAQVATAKGNSTSSGSAHASSSGGRSHQWGRWGWLLRAEMVVGLCWFLLLVMPF